MALLIPNDIYSINGVIIKEKIIPDGTRWTNNQRAVECGFSKGDLYKSELRLSGNTGKPQWITVHNTDDILQVNDDAEQYVRATYNENMRTSRVHFYIDDLGGWQLLKAGTGLCKNDPENSAEVGWHAGDGNVIDGGNMTSIGIEVIMNGDDSAMAYNNSAKVIAWLLWKHGLSIDRVVSHTYWVNEATGNIFDDVDIQSTAPVFGGKWCPKYIFNSNSAELALKNWKIYKSLIKSYMSDLNIDNMPDEWAKEAVNWALKNSILMGDDRGNYKLHSNCTRQDMIVFLHRALSK